MKKYLIILSSILLPIIAFAQFSGVSGISDFSPWRLSGTAMQPKVSSWTLGSSGTPIGSGFFTNLTTALITISNSVTGNLTVNGGTINLGASPNTATTTFIANGSGQLTLSAAGTNQNVVLTPSGTGSVVISTLGAGAVSSSVSGVLSSGTLSVGNGGTGAITFTSNGVLYGNGTGALQVTSQGAANSILTANAGAPSFSASPTIGTSVTVPTVIGGTAVSSTLALRSTSGVGSSDAILFQVGNNGATEAARINTSGNVGIGTTSPYMPFAVSTSGAQTAVFKGTVSNALVRIEGTGTVNNAQLTIGHSGTTAISLDAATGGVSYFNAGNVGIGTTSPFVALALNSGQEVVPAGSAALPSRAFTTDAASGLWLPAVSQLAFSTGGSERMRIDSSGNLGIGTVSPTAKLAVNAGGGNAALSTIAIFHGNSAQTGAGRLLVRAYRDDTTAANRYAELQAQDDAGDARSLVLQNGGGNVGIGTTGPTQQFMVAAGVNLSGLANGAGTAYICTTLATGVISTSTTACNGSSLRYKDNVQNIAYGLSDVLKLRPVSFDYKPELLVHGHQVGFLAEDMVGVIPEVVGFDKEGRPDNIDYAKLTSVLTKAIQEQQKEIDELKKEIQKNVLFCPTN